MRALASAALDECEKRGITTVIDTGSGRPWTRSLLGRVDHVIAPEKFVLKETGHSAERAALELWGDSCRVLFAVTQGQRGGVFTTGKGPEHLQRWETAPVAGVDSCGAGDTFHGAYAWALARGLLARRVLRYRLLVRGAEGLSARQPGHSDPGAAGARTRGEPRRQARAERMSQEDKDWNAEWMRLSDRREVAHDAAFWDRRARDFRGGDEASPYVAGFMASTCACDRARASWTWGAARARWRCRWRAPATTWSPWTSPPACSTCFGDRPPRMACGT